MQKIKTTAAVGLALLSMAMPAAAQNREHLQLAAELHMLQEQNQQLSLALTQLTDALKAVNARLDASEEFQRRRFADQEVLVKNLGSDLGTIRERTQDTDTRLRTLKDEIDALQADLPVTPRADRSIPGRSRTCRSEQSGHRTNSCARWCDAARPTSSSTGIDAA